MREDEGESDRVIGGERLAVESVFNGGGEFVK